MADIARVLPARSRSQQPRSAEERLERLLQFIIREQQHEVDGQHHAVVVLHKVAGMRVEDGDFIEVAVEEASAPGRPSESPRNGWNQSLAMKLIIPSSVA